MDTATTMFLVPGLGFNIDTIRYRYGFINAYLADVDYDMYENAVYLLFKPKDMHTFQTFLERSEGPRIIDDYDYEGGYVVVVYEFPSEFRQEFKMFMKGKYSQFREKYRVLLPQVDSKIDKEGNPFTEYSLQFMVCHKAKALKDYWEKKLEIELDEEDEYWSVPDIKRETLNIEKIKKKEELHENTQ